MSEREMRKVIDKYLKRRHERMMTRDSAVIDLLSGSFNGATIADTPTHVDQAVESTLQSGVTTAGGSGGTASSIALDSTDDSGDVEIASYTQGTNPL